MFVHLQRNYLQCHKDSMCLADHPHNYRSLLNCFLCILYLEDSALWRTMGMMRELSLRKQPKLYSQSHRIIVIVISEHFKSLSSFRLILELVGDLYCKEADLALLIIRHDDFTKH